ncbi:pyrroloquinoline quinone-dependent dehydrogenase [Lewinella sp. 4G2]|uniref:pyrroloquinoline quinone-dependent dehydrogenase n=1 Tax=Lewinella sp. 4G2 TaxID=1803372 RepID=UPI0007B4917D|nr:pyrroloquinoline quinone-dependent dehydrogenase [Lewinella sp. 4G2]OAV44768.1 pyrrolo-quinoline quinone [Lewinella sp. 4G2]
MHKLLSLPLLLLLLCTCAGDKSGPNAEGVDTDWQDFTTWAHYGGDLGLNHYSSSTQISAANVDQLEVAWTYRTGDADTANASQIQCNPIVVDGVLYGSTPQMRLFAVDAATGKHHWTFDPDDDALDENGSVYKHIMINSRGLTHWKGDDQTRLFFTAGSLTYAIDAADGSVIKSFGTDGYIDLHKDLGRDVDENFVVSTSPGIVFEDLLIMGTRVDETLPAAPGHIRAYDVRTGELAWIFHTIPQPGEQGYETWDNPTAWEYTGGGNPWSGFSLDPERGVVYCGTGSSSYDFYGANRPGTNLFANCILALDARTGERKWHYQTVHHDLWDKDHPTPPMLVTVDHDGNQVDAVAQVTKNGDLFLLDRDSGEPLFPVEEVPVPTEGAFPEEYVHPTQPKPTLPKPFGRQELTPNDLNPYMSEADKEAALAEFQASRYGHPYLPPGEQKIIFFPGMDGGAEWGGPAFDPETGLLYVNANNIARFLEMIPNTWEAPGPETWARAGHRIYNQHCLNCHGTDRAGTGNNPSLINIGDRYDTPTFSSLMRRGRRMMPAFGHLEEEEINALASFVLEQEKEGKRGFTIVPKSPEEDPTFLPYKLKGYTKFLASDGMPAISPPWGTLTAINLNTGEHAWQVPLGEYAHYKAAGYPATGTENYGGPVVTAGGLLFIAATSDGLIRAFDKASGEIVWEHELPASGFATPSVYELNGRQYIVIACGGGKLGTKASDAYVAFALPGRD